MFLHGNYITVHLWGKKKEKEITQKPKLLETKVIIKWAQGFFFFFFFNDKSDLLEQLE